MDKQSTLDTLVPDIRREVNWFAEGEQKHFVDPVTLSAIAVAVITAFLSGAAEEAGKGAFAWIVETIRGHMGGHKTAVSDGDLEAALLAARTRLATLPPAQAAERLAHLESELADQFASVMPQARAQALAARVQTVSNAMIDPSL